MTVFYVLMHGQQFTEFASSNRLAALRLVCGVSVVEFVRRNLCSKIRTSSDVVVLQIEGTGADSVGRSLIDQVPGSQYFTSGKRKPARSINMASAVARALSAYELVPSALCLRPRARVLSRDRISGRFTGRGGVIRDSRRGAGQPRVGIRVRAAPSPPLRPPPTLDPWQ